MLLTESTSTVHVRRAEMKFREALERLKCGNPIHLPKGAKVSQNNVAREAGVDPTALRKARFPELVEEIQTWIAKHGVSTAETYDRRASLASRASTRGLRQQLADTCAQRDEAMSKLVDAESNLLALMQENQRLQALLPQSSVTAIGTGRPIRGMD